MGSTKTMVHKGTSDEDTNLLVKDLTENLDRINISCDQITFNPLDETVTMTACKLNPDLHNTNQNTDQYNILQADGKTAPVPNPEQDEYNYDWSNDTNFRDVICLGSIVMLILIWLSVFIFYEIFYEIADIESVVIDHKIINKDVMDEDITQLT